MSQKQWHYDEIQNSINHCKCSARGWEWTKEEAVKLTYLIDDLKLQIYANSPEWDNAEYN